MDVYFYLAMAILIAIEMLRSKRQKQTVDAKQIVSNVSCGALLAVSQPITELSYMPAFIWLMQHPVINLSLWPSWLQYISAIIILDFTVYCMHRLQHAIPILWTTHAPHHQATQMNLSVSLRQSTLGFWFVWLAAVPLLVLNFNREVIVITLLFHRCYDSLLHSEIPISFGKIELILTSPSLHRVHHGYEDLYRDKNFASVFIAFDRMLGTFQAPLEKSLPIGINKKKGPIYNPFWANIEPYAQLLKVRKLKRLFTFTPNK